MTAKKKKKAEVFEFEPIGFLATCFKEKFGIPRQSGMVNQAKGILKLRDDPDFKIAIKFLDKFSHLWLVFVFHQPGSRKWKPSIRPPRLGGAKKVGVLASRSPHRPNPIGLSAVELERVDLDAPGGPEIHVRGVDLLDGTPILDLKPYIPYADCIPHANSGWAAGPIARIPVDFTEKAEARILEGSHVHSNLRALVLEVLELDPRPAFQRGRMPPNSAEAHGTQYGFRLLGFDVKWEIREGRFIVLDLEDVPPNGEQSDDLSKRMV